MQNRIEPQLQVAREEADVPTREALVEKRDLGALWAVGIVLSLIVSLAGFAWNPARYEPVQSNSIDSTEAQIENNQNKMVSDALNDGRIEYHSSMAKVVRLRAGSYLFLTDLFKALLFPTLPITILGLLIRKTLQQPKASR
ncbi:MAG: hypothetical protein HY282_03060 [Nitrospirae bacterium]|nr:hypothetical protein [Candidatus Manganitrophaceae bacterium]